MTTRPASDDRFGGEKVELRFAIGMAGRRYNRVERGAPRNVAKPCATTSLSRLDQGV
jgi:hypothetical protein